MYLQVLISVILMLTAHGEETLSQSRLEEERQFTPSGSSLKVLSDTATLKTNDESNPDPSVTKREASALAQRAYFVHRDAHLPQIHPDSVRIQSHSFREPPRGLRRIMVPVVSLALQRQGRFRVPGIVQPTAFQAVPFNEQIHPNLLYLPNVRLIPNFLPGQGGHPFFFNREHQPAFVTTPLPSFSRGENHFPEFNQIGTNQLPNEAGLNGFSKELSFPDFSNIQRPNHLPDINNIPNVNDVSAVDQIQFPDSQIPVALPFPEIHQGQGITRLNTAFPITPPPSLIPERKHFFTTQTPAAQNEISATTGRDSGFLSSTNIGPIPLGLVPTHAERFLFPNVNRFEFDSLNSFASTNGLNGIAPLPTSENEPPLPKTNRTPKPRIVPRPVKGVEDFLNLNNPPNFQRPRLRRQYNDQNKYVLDLPPKSLTLLDNKKETIDTKSVPNTSTNSPATNKRNTRLTSLKALPNPVLKGIHPQQRNRGDKLSTAVLQASLAVHPLLQTSQTKEKQVKNDKKKNEKEAHMGREEEQIDKKKMEEHIEKEEKESKQELMNARKRLRKGRKRQRPFERGPIIRMSEVLRNLTSPYSWEKTNNAIDHPENLHGQSLTHKTEGSEQFTEFVGPTSSISKQNFYRKSEENANHALQTPILDKDTLNFNFMRSRNSDSLRAKNGASMQPQLPQNSDKEQIFNENSKSSISSLNPAHSNDIPSQTWQWPTLEFPFASEIVSGVPFLIDGHNHLGPFVVVSIDKLPPKTQKEPTQLYRALET